MCVCVFGEGIEFHSFERWQYADRSGGNITNKCKAAPNYQPVTHVTVRVPVMAAVQIMSAPDYWLPSSLANTSQYNIHRDSSHC